MDLEVSKVVLATLSVLGLLACGDPGGDGRVAPNDAGADVGVDGEPHPGADAAGDAGPSLDETCDAWCAALTTACGAGSGDCAADCKTRAAGFRSNCVSAFQTFFACVQAGSAWSCVGPGTARVDTCADELAAYAPCVR